MGIRSLLNLHLADFVKNIIFTPRKAFNDIKNGKYDIGVYFFFALGAAITFSKAVFTGHVVYQGPEPFVNKTIILLVRYLRILEVAWVVRHLTYFLFLLCVVLLCKMFTRRFDTKPLMLSFMSLSAIGVIMQFIFYVLKHLVPSEIILVLFWVTYLWVVVLSLLAIKETQNISNIKALICFFAPALIFIPIAGPTLIAPYLTSLGR